MNALTKITAPANADHWVDEARPVIRACLDLDCIMAELLARTKLFEKRNDAEQFIYDAYTVLDKVWAEIRDMIDTFREEAIDRAHPWHNRWASFTNEQEESDALDLIDELRANTIGTAAAIKNIDREGK